MDEYQNDIAAIKNEISNIQMSCNTNSLIHTEVSEQIAERQLELNQLQDTAEAATKLAEDRDESVKINMDKYNKLSAEIDMLETMYIEKEAEIMNLQAESELKSKDVEQRQGSPKIKDLQKEVKIQKKKYVSERKDSHRSITAIQTMLHLIVAVLLSFILYSILQAYLDTPII